MFRLLKILFDRISEREARRVMDFLRMLE